MLRPIKRTERRLLGVSELVKVPLYRCDVLEQNDPPKHILDDLWEVLCRVHGLACGNRNAFRTTVYTWFASMSTGGSEPEDLQANEAVTNTDAKPPIPPTNGAPGMCQFSPPM